MQRERRGRFEKKGKFVHDCEIWKTEEAEKKREQKEGFASSIQSLQSIACSQ
jgi:hypothetical protein